MRSVRRSAASTWSPTPPDEPECEIVAVDERAILSTIKKLPGSWTEHKAGCLQDAEKTIFQAHSTDASKLQKQNTARKIKPGLPPRERMFAEKPEED